MKASLGGSYGHFGDFTPPFLVDGGQVPIHQYSHRQGLTTSEMSFTPVLLLLAVLCLTHNTAVQPHSMLSAFGFAVSCTQYLLGCAALI
jgi:hypothetical protein